MERSDWSITRRMILVSGECCALSGRCGRECTPGHCHGQKKTKRPSTDHLGPEPQHRALPSSPLRPSSSVYAPGARPLARLCVCVRAYVRACVRGWTGAFASGLETARPRSCFTKSMASSIFIRLFVYFISALLLAHHCAARTPPLPARRAAVRATEVHLSLTQHSISAVRGPFFLLLSLTQIM